MRAHASLPSILLVSCAFASLGLGACARTLPSVPTTPGHHYSPASIGEGNTAISGTVGGGGAVFTPGLVYADVSARHGITDRLDVGGRATGAGVLGNNVANPPQRGLFAARLFVHHETVRRILALHAGLGGGGSAAGGFVAADVGFTVGYENAYVVPFVSGQFFASIPATKHTLDLRASVNDEPLLRSPYVGFGPIASGGLRIPLGPRGAAFGSLSLGIDFVLLAGNAPESSGGVDAPFGITSGFVTYEHRLGALRAAAH